MPPTTTTTTDTVRTDALHDALERLEGYSYLDGGGVPCHGPMGAEALSALGHDDLVAGWVEGYKARHVPIDAPPRKTPVDVTTEAAWTAALGDFARIDDWADAFTQRLDDEPWPDVLATWVPRLLPGYGGALAHGLIRTAHAVRALSEPELSTLQRDELARGLALWAAAYLRLPGRPELHGTRPLADAIAHLPRGTADWNPMEAAMFVRLDELDDFAGAVEALGPPSTSDGDDALGDLSAAFCRVMLDHPDAPVGPLVHTVTPIAAVRALTPYAPTLTAASVYAQLWQVDAGLVAGLTDRHVIDGTTAKEPPATTEELAERAVENQDPHAMKFVEACLREHARRPDDVYLHAARHVVERSTPW